MEYRQAEVELIYFESEDVIATSVGDEPGPAPNDSAVDNGIIR